MKEKWDLVNICLLGYDPDAGRSFRECNDEFLARLDAVEKRRANGSGRA